MSTAKTLDLISVEDYLAGELISTAKHEYLGGEVYATAGAREVFHDPDAVLPLPEIEIDLPLAEIYEAVEFTPEPGEDEVE